MRNIIVYLFCILQITISVDFYEILGVSKDAKEQEIKQAFRQLSKEYHPDRRPGDQAAQARFMEINRAYEVLSDPEQRKRYDIFGEADMDKQRQRGPDQMFQLSVSLEEVYVGAVKTITVQQKRQVCRQCKGTGAKDGKTQPCQKCGGRGVVIEKVNFGFVQMNTQNPCRQCGGTGKTFTSWCPVCRGQKVVTLNKNYDVEIEQGMDTGSTILFKGEGDESPDWNSGDLIFQLQVLNNNKFTRRGTNLFTTETLSIKEALLAYDKQINHLDNHKVQIKYDGITQPNSTRIIQGEGMPTHKFPSQRGNLFVTFVVQLPKTLSARQKELLVTFFES